MQRQQQTLSQMQERIRRDLAKNGTNVQQNDADPFGDGDQSAISKKKRQYHRELFAQGGDIAECFGSGRISEFAVACVTGNVPKVKELLEAANKPEDAAVPPDALVQLLERRETSMRLSPLLLIVSAGKNISPGGASGGSASFLQHVQIEAA
jgi:hypothetical protein